MADAQKSSFELSYAHSEERKKFTTPEEAGKAFSDADEKLGPRITESKGKGARTVAKTGSIDGNLYKQVPPRESLKSETDQQLWAGYHDREKERTQEQPAQVVKPALDNPEMSVAEPTTPQKNKSDEERFAMPDSFRDRFITTQENNRQDMYRSYNDKTPAISDKGESLHTIKADRGTAMDMMELAAHRGWSSMKVKGPEEFRREMWLEGTARGIEVSGYRPNDKDKVEAERRSELVTERVIERTDQPRDRSSETATKSDQVNNQSKESSNVVEMIDYKKGVTGKITDIGSAPYRDREGASPTPFVEMKLENGKQHKLWGVGLPDMIEKKQLGVGDKATIYDDGRRAVTVKELDPKTQVLKDKQSFRREWGARDIERTEPVQKRDESLIERDPPINAGKGEAMSAKHQEHSDRLEERIMSKEAANNPKLRGAASTLAIIDAEMRAAGVSDKDRAEIKAYAAQELANGMRAGRQYDVQKLPNITKDQQARAKNLSPKDVSKIIEQARVNKPQDRTNQKSPTQTSATEKPRERAQQQDRGR